MTPADLEIRKNHFYKPRIWQQGQPGYVGGKNGNPFVVKNHLELKNAQRVLFEANVLEYTWGGFSQKGAAILLTPSNQSGTCPRCQVTDITIRYSTISHVGAGLVVANGAYPGAVPLAGERYSVHDLVVDDVNGTAYNGPGLFAQVSRSPGAPLLRNVSFNHITAFAPEFLLWVGSDLLMGNFVVSNSIVNAGLHPIASTGGTWNCANGGVPIVTLTACFSPYLVTYNALVAAGSDPSSIWPAYNFFPTSAAAVQFVNFNNGNGGNYQLLSGSAYKNAASDGKDIGADIDAVETAITGVY